MGRELECEVGHGGGGVDGLHEAFLANQIVWGAVGVEVVGFARVRVQAAPQRPPKDLLPTRIEVQHQVHAGEPLERCPQVPVRPRGPAAERRLAVPPRSLGAKLVIARKQPLQKASLLFSFGEVIDDPANPERGNLVGGVLGGLRGGDLHVVRTQGLLSHLRLHFSREPGRLGHSGRLPTPLLVLLAGALDSAQHQIRIHLVAHGKPRVEAPSGLVPELAHLELDLLVRFSVK
mmetsp:Transcript_64344/g.145119  ORF Transcript_64344/g.145119 Transcript_64344/m.145119 type:complete len:233 (+) Transcript_64344:979-1677(+)